MWGKVSFTTRWPNAWESKNLSRFIFRGFVRVERAAPNLELTIEVESWRETPHVGNFPRVKLCPDAAHSPVSSFHTMKPAFGIVFVFISASLMAQQPPANLPVRVPQVLGRSLESNIGNYTDRPADFTLVPHGSGARHGEVWIQNIGYGLLVVGKVDGPQPEFPRNKDLILEKDHVEIWLADGKDPELPPIGWGNQFDEVTLPQGADSCADWAQKGAAETPAAPAAAGAEKRCRTWAETQVSYRAYFKRLFVRQWLVTPEYAVEAFAAPAYDKITERFASDRPNNEEIPLPLKPTETLQMWFGRGKDGVGYTFEILIPFQAFPPLSTTEMRDLRLMVDVFNPPEQGRKVGSYSTTSASRIYAATQTFNRVALDPPHQFRLTPCEVPLAARDKYRDIHPAWFVPKTSQDSEFESDAFIILNDGAGYQYEPEALSPVVRPVHYFWHWIGGNEYICGPYLTYRRGDKLLNFDAEVDEDGFDAKRLPGGDLLIKVGPRVYGSEFGSGQCGACPRTDLRIFRVGADLRLAEMLNLGGIIDNGAGASQDFSISRDWAQVVQYDHAGVAEEGKPDVWSSTTWCRGEAAYKKCDHQDIADPPDPPLLKELRTE